MKHKSIFLIAFFCLLFAQSQIKDTHIIVKNIKVKNRILNIDSLSISPYYFKLYSTDKKEIDSTVYNVDFAKAIVTFNTGIYNDKNVLVHYKKLPNFLTRTYKIFDESLIIDNPNKEKPKFYQLEEESNKESTPIFDGLETTGHLSRGITMGNNQDGVVNSGLRLQLKGKLSRKVSINANITDNNIPLQENGYTQRLNEYDRIFIEMYSDKWKLTAGDLFLNNDSSKYLNFNKKVAGLGLNVNLKNDKSTINLYSSGAVVESEFKSIKFNGQEANQGPYRLSNTNNPYLLIITGSETVYMNGLVVDKKQYTVDYSASEITFNTTYPINSDMRIVVEFQASEQSYTRFVSFNKASYSRNNFDVEVDFYSENDSKTKNLQQDLNSTQEQVLFNAGDDVTKMYTLSAVKGEYIENKIQYKKEIIAGNEAFIYSNITTDEVYDVRFTFVGKNQGDYIIENTIATGRIYKYVTPIASIKQGDFEPKIQLKAPKKLQVIKLKTNYNTDRTTVLTDLAFSNRDLNLFSTIDDIDNQGFAGTLLWKQRLLDRKWKLESTLSYEQINADFNSVERINNVEFDRSWNIENIVSNQGLFKTTLMYSKITDNHTDFINYQFENLNFSNSFDGNKHILNADLSKKATTLLTNVSLMNSISETEKSTFFSLNTAITHQFSKILVGAKYDSENNLREDKILKQLNDLSFKNQSYNTYLSVKDSLRIKLELGYLYKTNDSIQTSQFVNANKSNNYYLKSDIIKNKKTDLSVYLNYRQFSNRYFNNDQSINSKINYRQQLLGNFIQFKTLYETNSGTVPQQEFNYLEVDSGKGYYTWKDYNDDGIQDLDEFEIAQFSDEATYVRVLLPSTKFIRTNKTKLEHLITINPIKWANSTTVKKIISHFINQVNISVTNKQLKQDGFQFNPFETDNALSLQQNFKNYLFFNRGKQHYSFTYSYLNTFNKTVFVIGLLKNKIRLNQLQFVHKIDKTWLIDLETIYSNTINSNERFVSRNMDLDVTKYKADLSYLFNSQKSSLKLSYKNSEKKNNSIINETLLVNNLGMSFTHQSKQDFTIYAALNYIDNDYNANQNSPIAYQLMEGLQNGRNFTWTLNFQKRITSYLDVNLNYNARKSDKLNTIHTGTIQLRANF